MSNKMYGIIIKGDKATWMFPVEANDEHYQDWIADGLDVVELMEEVPSLARELRLSGQWRLLKNIFTLRWPFR